MQATGLHRPVRDHARMRILLRHTCGSWLAPLAVAQADWGASLRVSRGWLQGLHPGLRGLVNGEDGAVDEACLG